MVPASKNIEKLAETAAVYLGRSPTEKGVDRLMASMHTAIDVDAALADMVFEGKSIFPTDGIFSSRDVRDLGNGLQARWELRAYPMGYVGIEGVGATPEEAVSAFRKSHKLAVLRKQIEDKAKRELDALSAIDAGTKGECDPNYAHKREFLENMDRNAKGE